MQRENSAISHTRPWSPVNAVFSRSSELEEPMKSFYEQCAAEGKVWDLAWHKGKLLALLSKSNAITVKVFGSSQEQHQVCNSTVTFGRFETEGEAVLLFAGDESGSAYCFRCDLEQATAHQIAVFIPPPHLRNTGVQFLLPQPTVSGQLGSTSPRELKLWLVTASHVLLLSALLDLESTAELQLRLDLHVPACDSSVFLHLELLPTRWGAASLLAVHFLAPTKEGARVQMAVVDARLALCCAEQNHESYQVTQEPLLDIPFEPRSQKSTAPGTEGWMGTLLSLGGSGDRGERQGGESVAGSVVETHSLRCAGPRDLPLEGRDTLPQDALQILLARPPACSFDVRVLGSAGTVVVASYIAAQQALLDTIAEAGVAAFSSSATLCGPFRASAQYSSFNAEGGPCVVDRPLDIHDSGSVQQELWRACLHLQVLPSCRLAELQRAKQQVEAQVGGGAFSLLGRIVLMETALYSGLAAFVAEYIVAHSGYSNSGDEFLLTDVKRVFEWAAGLQPVTLHDGELQPSFASVQVFLEQRAYLLCSNTLFPALLQVPASCPAACRAELLSLLDGAVGLQLVHEALLRRKVWSVEGAEGKGAMLEEGYLAISSRLQQATCLVQTLSMLLEVAAQFSGQGVSLRCLLPSSAPSSSGNGGICWQQMQERQAIAPQAFDELCKLLTDAASQEAVQGIFSARGDLAAALARLIFMPLRAVKEQAALSMQLCAQQPSSAPQILEQLEASVPSISQLRTSVVLYLLIDAAAANMQSAPSAVHSAITHIVRKLGSACDTPSSVTLGVLALWQTDAGVQVGEAVRLICNAGTSILQDEGITAAVVQRLVATGAFAECERLLSHLRSIGHPVALSRVGVVATASVIRRADCWQLHWHRAKALCAALPAASVDGAEWSSQSTAQREIMRVLVRWAFTHGCMGSLLDAVLNKVETEEVGAFLEGLAVADVAEGVCPSAAVDLFVSFLLREKQHAAAMDVHCRHSDAASARREGASQGELGAMQQSLQNRQVLLTAQKSLPTIPLQ
ncbi:hypothetical protein B484DRAFT_453440 [Ochromonadaceae sp. CCMP2298]|nr:hypothetical protein B484DRAFT_453440 [Ochromonadaceae sp. CCMP2298]